MGSERHQGIAMPKKSEALAAARREEIIDACAALYETMSFRDITIRDIGRQTTFTRTSIYNYFRTKEEIFLALLQREHDAWTEDLRAMLEDHRSMTAVEFADRLASTLQRRRCMLKLMSMNIYDMESNSRIENLAAFKRSYRESKRALASCLEKFFPTMEAKDVQEFLYAFFPFLFGIYPYTEATAKQKEAMALADVEYMQYSIHDISESIIFRLIKDFER